MKSQSQKIINQKNRAVLRGFSEHLTALNKLGVDSLATHGLAEMFDEAAKNEAVPMMAFHGEEVTVESVMIKARQKDADAITALQALRMQNIDLYVRATLDFGMFYADMPLEPDEQPVIMSTFRNPVNVRFSGEDGGVRGVKAVKAQQPVYVNMRELHTDTVSYPMRDINQGTDVASASQKTFDLAWDLRHRINIELLNFLIGGTINGTNYGQGIYRNFNFTGRSTNNTLVLHPSIDSRNLPTTNLIDYSALQAYGQNTNVISFYVLQAIIDYIEGFRGVFEDGDLEATGVIWMPSSEVSGLLKTLNPVGQFYSKVGEQVLNSFTKVEYGGRVWTLIGNPLLPKGACYPVLNKKVANFYTKPSMDFEDVQSFPLKNREDRTAVKVMAQAMVEPWRVNGLRVIYSNLAGAGQFKNNKNY